MLYIRSLLCACALFFTVTATAFGTEAAVPVADAPDDGSAHTAWITLFEQRNQIITDIREKVLFSDEKLSEELKALGSQVQGISSEYQALLAIIQISRNLPMELGLVQDQLQRLSERLTHATTPLEAQRLNALAGLEELSQMSLSTDSTGQSVAQSRAAQAYMANSKETQKALTSFSGRLGYSLDQAQSLKQQITNEQTTINTTLPGLWRKYYLSSSQKFFDLDGWSRTLETIKAFTATFPMRMQAQIPSTLREISQAAIRAVVALAFLGGLTLLPRRFISSLHPVLFHGMDRIVRNSLPWLYGGIALYVAAWAPNNPYLILLVAGTIFLCIGQMRLAWDIRVFLRPELPRETPLKIIFLPLLLGLVLLFFNLPPEPLGFLWILALAFCLWLEPRRKPSILTEFALERNLLLVHKVVLWMLLAISLTGWGRLSILLCMVFAMVTICIQQAVAFVKLSTEISELIPETGLRGLIQGVALALAVPVLLVIFSLSMGLWILAYPGGSYLLTQIANTDISLGERSLNFIQILLILSAFYITRSAIAVGRFFLRQLSEQNVGLDQTLVSPFQTIYRYVLWALFAIYVLSTLGFNMTSLAVVAGGLSVGIGLGLQGLVNNFVSGLTLIFSQTIREGDIVEIDGVHGTVRNVAIRSTTVETFDSTTVFVPNASLLSNNLINLTRNGRTVRRSFTVGVAYGSDIRKVLKVLNTIVESHPNVFSDPAPSVSFTDFGDSALMFTIRVWLDISQELGTLSELRIQVCETFEEQSINIAYPQLDVHFPDGLPQKG